MPDLCSAGGPGGAEAAVGGSNDGAAVRIVDIDVLRANLLELPVSRGSVDGTANLFGILEHYLAVILGCKRIAGSIAQNVLRETLPGSRAVLRVDHNTAVTSTDERDVGPAPAIGVPTELEPCAEPVGLAVEHGGVNSALDTALKAIGEGQELSGAGCDPNVLVRNCVAVVVEGVKAPPVAVGVGDEDTLAASVAVTPGQSWRRVAGPVALGL